MAEKKYSLKVAKVLGVADDSYWSQISFFTPQEKEKRNKRGSLLAAFSAKAPEDNFRPEFGKELISRLQEEYYGQLSGWPMTQLVTALKTIAEELEDNSFSFEIGVTAAVFWQGIWYFAVLGKGRVLVKRGPTVSAVLVGEAVGKVVSSSGQAEDEDLIMLGTEEFFNLSESVIQEALGEDSLQGAAEVLSPALVERENNGASAGLLARLSMAESSQKETTALSQETKPSDSSDRSKRLPEVSLPGSIPWKIVGLVIAIIGFLLGGFFGLRRWRKVRQSRVEKQLAAVEQAYQEAELLAPSDRQEAEKLYQQAREELSAINSDWKKEEQQKWQGKITAALEEPGEDSGKETSREELPVFLSLQEQDEGQEISDLSLLGEEIYWLDKKDQKIYRTDWKGEEITVLTGDERIKDSLAFFTTTGRTLLLTDAGLYQVTDKKLDKILEADDEWGKITDLTTWFGNIYLLDTGENTIWQYPAIEDGYANIRSWNEEDLPQLDSSITINGAIWVTGEGKLYRLWQGYLDETFAIENLAAENLLFTTADFDNIYIVDKTNYRFLTVSKEEGEISFEKDAANLDKATGMVVSADETVALISTPGKIYKINLTEEETDSETTPEAGKASSE